MVYLWFTGLVQHLHNVQLARDMQDMRIRKKKRQTIRPFPGSLFLNKTAGMTRTPLKVAVNGKPPARYTPKQASTGPFQSECTEKQGGFDVFVLLFFSCTASGFL